MTESEIVRISKSIPSSADRSLFLGLVCAGNSHLLEKIASMVGANARVKPAIPNQPGVVEFQGASDYSSLFSTVPFNSITPFVGSIDDLLPITEPAESSGNASDPAVNDVKETQKLNRSGDQDDSDPFRTEAQASPRFEPVSTLIGQVINGRYRLLGLIGQGGMGSVYRAEQLGPLKREVALKLIKNGIDSRKVVARFNAERQALAIMDHPGIARVYDAGETENQQPYFVMELVDGLPITKFCDKQRLSVQARLELIVAVCAAVQHAHQKGIIHRDLKPSNILVTMVDGRPVPKVIDFGVAKAIDIDLSDATLWDSGTIVGTPAYMSPEQANPSSMDIDTRTDVFALGVITYELLVGSPPIDTKEFRRGAMDEVLRMVRELEPQRPSTKLSNARELPNIAANRSIEPGRLAKSLHGELDWVVMKAIDKNRNRRYETANALGLDLQRYLSNEVVEARPPSIGYRLGKFVRRNQVEVSAASLVFLSLIGGVVGTTAAMLHAQDQQRITKESLESLKIADAETVKQKQRAERSFASAERVIVGLSKLLRQIEIGNVDKPIRHSPMNEAFDGSETELHAFLAESPNNQNLHHQASLLHRFAGNIARRSNLFTSADYAYATAIDTLSSLNARFPDNPTYPNELALALIDRANYQRNQGKLHDALSSIDSAVKILETQKTDKARSVYDGLFYCGLAQIDRAVILDRLGRFEEALRSARTARELLTSLEEPTPPETRHPREKVYLTIAMISQGKLLEELKLFDEALSVHEAALTLSSGYVVGSDTTVDHQFQHYHARYRKAHTELEMKDRWEAASRDLGQVIEKVNLLREGSITNRSYCDLAVAAYTCRAQFLLRLDRAEEAIKELEKGKNLARNFIAAHGPTCDSYYELADCNLTLGQAYQKIGQIESAKKSLQSAKNVFTAGVEMGKDYHNLNSGLIAANRLAAQIE